MRFLISLFLLTLSGAALSSGGGVNSEVQASMKSFVKEQTLKNTKMPIVYQGKILELEVMKSEKYPDGFHAGVKTKGNLYVSCADFVDKKGNKYDIDFLVKKNGNKYSVVQPIVHSVNGIKNPYDLSH